MLQLHCRSRIKCIGEYARSAEEFLGEEEEEEEFLAILN